MASTIDNKTVFHSVISSIQKIALYETKTRLYLVGSNSRETRFRVLEIDRTKTNQLRIHENPNELDAKEIRKFLSNIGYSKSISAYGILGFIKFLEGYYLILVTKRTLCAVVGRHLIYTIKDTVLLRVNDPNNKQFHPLEVKYLKLFCNVDLASNFYFSYSYDLTRTLQYNLSPPKFVGSDTDIEQDDPIPDWDRLRVDASEKMEYAFRGTARKRFVWNAFLLKPMANIMQKDWKLEVIHGFVSQSSISIFGRPVYVSLIARRSTRFAGTRFLKRGANSAGDVANEVETEQIVMDGQRLCSFVQMRGSIPSHWSQDISKMVPKPPISLDLSDPYAITAGKHYERLLFHYGAPVIILNLVKKREKRKHESILTEDMLSSVKYLNQFLPPQCRIKYNHFDMARKSRGDGNVMDQLADIAEKVIHETGFFFCDSNNNDKSVQTGIVRVNCVDCLDRTNSAQFAIGKSVLAHQLHRLGFIKPAKIEFDSDCVTMLETLFELHGDTLALQYGGSQLVHRIKTYRKTAAWASQGNDIMQTLSRYYSNTFSDTEKQHSINLFLGYFNPSQERVPIWDLPTDYYMHNIEMPFKTNKRTKEVRPLTQWVSPIIRKFLPNSTSDANKIVAELIRVHSNELEMIDSYFNYYLPYRFTSLEEQILYQISSQARNFMPTFRTNYSPFIPGIHRHGRNVIQNPSMSGQSSTSSTTSSTDTSTDEDSSSEDDVTESMRSSIRTDMPEETPKFSFESNLPVTKEVYGFDLKSPAEKNLLIYKNYAQIGKCSSKQTKKNLTLQEYTKRRPLCLLNPLDDYENEFVYEPSVASDQVDIYKKYVVMPQNIDMLTSSRDLEVFQKYISFDELCSY